MADTPELESLYKEAQSALKARDYAQATELLKRILVLDENYRDASRLLARIVKIGRRRWYNDLRIWGPVIGVALIGLLIWLVPKLSLPALHVPTSTATITASPTVTLTPTNTAIPTHTPSPSPTVIPLAWKRISMGQEFSRDQVTAIVFNPKDLDIIYVGLQNAGIYKSINGGLSWGPVHNGLNSSSISSLAIDPGDPSILYAVSQSGIYKTRDGGIRWELSYHDADMNGILSMDPQDGQHIFYVPSGGGGSMLETLDGGTQWTTMQNSCPASIFSLSFDPDSQTLWALNSGDDQCQAGLYRSNNGGRTWALKLASSQYGFSSFGGFAKVFTDQQNGNSVYVYMFDNNQLSNCRIVTSVDGGNTWVRGGTLTAYCNALAIDPDSGNTIYCGSNNFTTSIVYRTLDGGLSWQEVGYPNVESIGAFAISTGDHQVILVGGQGLAVLRGGGNKFEPMESGLGGRFIELKFNPTLYSNLYAYEGPPNFGAFCPLYYSQDRGYTWRVDNGSNYPNMCGLAIDASGSMLYRYLFDSLQRSYDNGETWNSSQIGFTHIIGLAAHPYQSGVLYRGIFGSNILAYSFTGGSTWKQTNPLEARLNWAHFYFDHDQGQVAYVDGEESNAIYRSADAGITWSVCRELPSKPGYPFRLGRTDSHLAIDPTNSDHLFIGTRGYGIFTSNSGCKFWWEVNDGLSDLYINTLAIDPNNPDSLYAGTDGGAYVSFDGGETWGQINDGLLGATVVYSIVVDKDSNVYAATPYGIFKLENK